MNNYSRILQRGFSTNSCLRKSYEFVVAGGGAGGIASAAALKRIHGKDATVAIIEPSQVQYFTEDLTLVLRYYIVRLYSTGVPAFDEMGNIAQFRHNKLSETISSPISKISSRKKAS